MNAHPDNSQVAGATSDPASHRKLSTECASGHLLRTQHEEALLETGLAEARKVQQDPVLATGRGPQVQLAAVQADELEDVAASILSGELDQYPLVGGRRVPELLGRIFSRARPRHRLSSAQ